MWNQIIGQNAGALWKIINAKGEQNLSSLKKLAKLDDQQMYLALGWLAREEKVKFTRNKGSILVALR